jgi:hypothetical protein
MGVMQHAFVGRTFFYEWISGGKIRSDSPAARRRRKPVAETPASRTPASPPPAPSTTLTVVSCQLSVGSLSLGGPGGEGSLFLSCLAGLWTKRSFFILLFV